MNELIQATAVLAAFAAAHERLIEFIRSVNDRLATTFAWWQRHPADWINRHTIGAGNMVIAVVMAFATQANLLALFCTSTPNSQQAMFFDLFMRLDPFAKASTAPHSLSPEALAIGYVLMGLTTALGSENLHNITKGLIDLRQQLQAVGTAGGSPPPPARVGAPAVIVSAGGPIAASPTPVPGAASPT